MRATIDGGMAEAGEDGKTLEVLSSTRSGTGWPDPSEWSDFGDSANSISLSTLVLFNHA